MSDSSERSRRKLPARRNAGSAVSATLGLALFLTPIFAFGRSIWAATEPRAIAGVELFVAIAGVIVLNGIFVAGETAIELIRGSHLKQVATEDRKVKILQDLIANKQLYVASCFLGSQTMRSWLVLLLIPFAFNLGEVLGAAWQIQTGWPSVLTAGFIIGIPAVALNVIFGELIPRSYAATDPVKAACRTFGFVRLFSVVFKPVAMGFLLVGGLVTRRFGASATFSVVNQAEEEIKERLEQAVETQEIEEDEKEMLHSVFEFGDTVAREVMTPRIDMDAVPVSTKIAEVARLVEETGHSRIPVYEGTDDQIIGIIHAKDVLSALFKGEKDTALTSIMRKPSFVPESKNLHDLLQEMRSSRSQMVIVQDEFGGTAGVVTIEDIVEEVVGEIVDEYDEDEQQVVKTGNSFTIGGKMNIEDVNDEIGTSFDNSEFDTLGGYVFGLFGKQPEIGESIESDGYRFTVTDTDGRRILYVNLERLEDDEPVLGKLLSGDTSGL